jgi:predicted porin
MRGTLMKFLKRGVAAWVCALIGLSKPGHAQDLSFHYRDIEFRAYGAVSAQGAAYKDVFSGIEDRSGDWDAYAVLTAERVTDNGLLIGLRTEFDTGGRGAEDLSRNELYAYVAGRFGRVELGEQDGPADSLSMHAPLIGLGQIRGEFVRYTGQPALLTPFDTRDSLKLVYLTPPWRGLRAGISYAPEFESNSGDPDPRRRTRQDNAFEVAATYQRPIGDVVAGFSAAYVSADADPVTRRGDISSWGLGGELLRGPLVLGAAYVSRGDSNSLTVNLDEDEWNAGVAWRTWRWGVAASAAVTSSRIEESRLAALGAYYEFAGGWSLRGDFVVINEENDRGRERDGQVGIVEISYRF